MKKRNTTRNTATTMVSTPSKTLAAAHRAKRTHKTNSTSRCHANHREDHSSRSSDDASNAILDEESNAAHRANRTIKSSKAAPPANPINSTANKRHTAPSSKTSTDDTHLVSTATLNTTTPTSTTRTTSFMDKHTANTPSFATLAATVQSTTAPADSQTAKKPEDYQRNTATNTLEQPTTNKPQIKEIQMTKERKGRFSTSISNHLHSARPLAHCSRYTRIVDPRQQYDQLFLYLHITQLHTQMTAIIHTTYTYDTYTRN